MPTFLRQSTASQEVLLGPFLDSTDGVTAETGLTIANTDIQVWKNGGTTEANKNSGGATHIAGGRYYTVLDATDTGTIGPMRLSVQVAGALAVWLDCCVLDEAVYDVMFGTTAPSTYAGGDTSGTTTLLSRIAGALTITAGRVDADVTHIAAAAVSTSTAQLGVNVVNFGGAAGTFAAGIPAVNATQLSGDSVAADNAEAFFDGTGYAGTNNVIPTVTTVGTLTTYTGNTPQTGDSFARIGAAGAGLTALGDTRIANLDATVSSRGTSSLTQTQVTGGAYSVQSASCVLGDARIANLDTTVSSRGTSTLTQTQVTGGAYNLASASATLGDTRLANLDATVSSRSSLTQAQVTGGAYSVQSALCVLGDARIGNLDATVSSRMATYTQPTGFLAATFPLTVASTTNITAGTITTATNVTTVNGLAANVLTAASMAADAGAEIADAVWDEVLSGHLTGGTTGAALNSAGSAGDPWGTALPGAYSAGSAGHIIGNRLDAAVTTRLAPTTAGRTLDVSTGGEAGVDWANVGSPTTTLDLSGTTISTGQVVASVSGSVQSVIDTVMLGTNTITSATLATSAVVEIQTGLSTLDAAGVRTAVGLASANLDTQLGTKPTLAQILAGGDVDGFTFEEVLKLCLAALAGKVSGGATTTITIRAADDSKARLTATVDADGNRSAVTYDATG